jgi:hypothetical protein
VVAPRARERYQTVFHPDVVTRRLIDVYANLSAKSHPQHR